MAKKTAPKKVTKSAAKGVKGGSVHKDHKAEIHIISKR